MRPWLCKSLSLLIGVAVHIVDFSSSGVIFSECLSLELNIC